MPRSCSRRDRTDVRRSSGLPPETRKTAQWSEPMNIILAVFQSRGTTLTLTLEASFSSTILGSCICFTQVRVIPPDEHTGITMFHVCNYRLPLAVSSRMDPRVLALRRSLKGVKDSEYVG